MPAPKPRNEANTALIIFLILFIITTIGLGVSTYTGYAADEGKDQLIATEKSKATALEYERDWYKFCALLFLDYTGELQGDALENEVKEWNTLRDKFLVKRSADGGLVGTGTLPDAKMTEQPKVLPKKTVEMLITRLEENFPYKEVDGVLKQTDTLAKRVADEKKKYDQFANQNKQLKRREDEAEANATATRAQMESDKKVYEDARVKTQASVTEELKKYQGQFDGLIKENTRLTNELKAQRESAEKATTDLNTRITALQAEITRMQLVSADREKKEATDLEERQTNNTARKVPTDFRIVQIDARGLVGYINAGSADHVTPQLTFSVYGVTPDGRVDTTSKATVEVVNVVEAHLSQVRITSQRAQKLD